MDQKNNSSFCSSVTDRHNRPANTWHEAAAAIHDFWTHLWSEHAQFRIWLLDPIGCSPVSVSVSRAQSGKGTGGPDGWAADEIKHLPFQTFEILSQLFEQFATIGEVPLQFQQARMVCLPKPGKVKNHAVSVDGTRPITIMSVWWRLWVSTLCQSHGLKTWLKAALHPSVGAVSQQDIYENLISIFDNFHQHGYLLALDFSKAFDAINTDMSVKMLNKYGWPPAITRLLGLVWGTQQRFIQWDNHTHNIPLLASGVQPQGGPLGPVICSLWVQSGVNSVSEEVSLREGSFSMQVYLDDRSCTTSSPSDLQNLQNAWSSWSHLVGLKENLQKAEVSGMGSARLSSLSQCFDAAVVSPAVRVLGAVSWSGRRKLHKIELDRLAAAKASARLLGCCGFLLPLQLRYLKHFALPKANYGWVARGPTWSAAKSLWSACWVSTHRVRYSSPWLRALFLGGKLHLDVVWVTRLVAAVLRARFRSGNPS